MCRCTYTWLLYVVRQSHVLPASWMRLFWSHCMLHSLSRATQHTTWGKAYNTVLWITHLYKYTVHVMNTFVMCIQHFWVASFPGLPRFRSSVCVDNNTRKNFCVLLSMQIEQQERGRPRNEGTIWVCIVVHTSSHFSSPVAVYQECCWIL